MTAQQPEALNDQPAAKPVCEHYYASLCYRGMSVRLCQLCHEPDWDDLAEQLGAAQPSLDAALVATWGTPGWEATWAAAAAGDAMQRALILSIALQATGKAHRG
jgi:hypothetical protein